MTQRFFSLVGVPFIAFVACLATGTISASTGTGHIVYDLTDIAIEQDGLLKPALNRGTRSNSEQNEIRMERQCPCEPKCQCPADCACHSGGPCSRQPSMHQQGYPANPAYRNLAPSGHHPTMAYGNGPMYVQMVPVGDYGQSGGYGQQPMLVQVLPIGYGPGMVQESAPRQPTLMPEDISYVQEHGIIARRVKRQMERQNAAGWRVDRKCTVYPYDETWSGWQVYSLFDKVHNCCQAVPVRCNHYQPNFTRGQWHTITTLMPYYIKHLRARAGSSH